MYTGEQVLVALMLKINPIKVLLPRIYFSLLEELTDYESSGLCICLKAIANTIRMPQA